MHFKYRGKYSYDFGITVETQPERVSPETRMAYANIAGMNGNYTWRTGKKSYDLTMVIIVEGKENLEHVIGWLKGNGPYERTDIPGRFQYVSFKQEIQYQYVFDGIYRASVTMTAYDPFWYKTKDTFTPLTGTGNKYKVKNEGNVQSRPIIKFIKKTPRIEVKINDVVFAYTFPHNDSYVEIDCRKEFSHVNNNRRDRMLDLVGEFPHLNVGDNIIEIREGSADVEIKYQDRWY